MRFSEHFNINSNGQNDLEFVDIRLDTDNRLFLDPTLMAVETREPFVRWNVIVEDFFNTILDFYNKGRTELARLLFNSSNESNEIFLGYSVGAPIGRGNSEDSLAEVFDYIHNENLLQQEIVGRVEDFHVFVPDFGPDFLSDLIASLLKSELISFTIEQCKLHDIKRTFEIEKPFWNHITHEWDTVTELVPEYNGKPIVLVPKRIIVREYLYSPIHYLSQYVAVWRQEYNRDNNTELHRERSEGAEFVSKKLIRKREITDAGLTRKQYLLNMTRENRRLIQQFRENIGNTQRGTNSNRMSDEELDEFIEKSYDQETLEPS